MCPSHMSLCQDERSTTETESNDKSVDSFQVAIQCATQSWQTLDNSWQLLDTVTLTGMAPSWQLSVTVTPSWQLLTPSCDNSWHPLHNSWHPLDIPLTPSSQLLTLSHNSWHPLSTLNLLTRSPGSDKLWVLDTLLTQWPSWQCWHPLEISSESHESFKLLRWPITKAMTNQLIPFKLPFSVPKPKQNAIPDSTW